MAQKNRIERKGGDRPKKVPPPPAKLARSAIVVHTKEQLPKALLLNTFDLMIKSRVLDERLIKVYKTGDAYFWIGGPGEEAFGVPLGLLTKKGHGPNFDFLHLHYRCTPTMIALGMEMIDSIRLIMNRATDPCTGGRNFSNHYCFPQWNVLPVSSPIEVQYSMAIGTAVAQKRRKTDAVTIVSGGDAGTAEGDFASALVWSSRPGSELPMYLTVQNNRWGISTDFSTQHGEKSIADRGRAFGIQTRVVDGNDPIESYLAIQADLKYVREKRKPALTEFQVSRLYGHSSATGANREKEVDCIERFERVLVDRGYIKSGAAAEIFARYDDQSRLIAEKVRAELPPERASIWDHIYANNENADWRKF